MKNPGPVDQAVVHLAGGQAGVGPGLAGKAEFPIPGAVQGDKGQGGKDGGIAQNALRPDAQLLKGVYEQMPEGVVPHLAQQGGGAAVPLEGGKEISGRAPRLGGEGRVSGAVRGLVGEINEQLTQGDYICHGIISFP